MSDADSVDVWSVLLVDRCPVIQAGLEEIFRGTSFVLSERVDSLAEAKRHMTIQEIHLVLSDFEFDEGSLADLWRICSGENIPLLVFSTCSNPAFVARAAGLGIHGLVDKRVDAESLLEAFGQAVRGEKIWSRQLLRRANGSMVAKSLASRIEFPLTEREMQVLRCLANGNSNQMIAERLNVGFETAKEHVQHVLAKLGVTDRTQAAVTAQRHGLL